MRSLAGAVRLRIGLAALLPWFALGGGLPIGLGWGSFAPGENDPASGVLQGSGDHHRQPLAAARNGTSQNRAGCGRGGCAAKCRCNAEASADLAERVRAACRQQLADFKRPHEVRLVDSLPRSTLEKIAKAQLRTALANVGVQVARPAIAR